MRYRDLLRVKWSKRLRRRPHRPRLRRRVNRPSRWLEQIRRAALCSGQTSAGRRGKTRGRSTHDRIVRHRGCARQAPRTTLVCALVNDFSPLINELWPRLEDQYRWELHSYGLPKGYDKLVVADIIVLLIEALKGIGATDNKLIQAQTKADHHNPSSPDAA